MLLPLLLLLLVGGAAAQAGIQLLNAATFLERVVDTSLLPTGPVNLGQLALTTPSGFVENITTYTFRVTGGVNVSTSFSFSTIGPVRAAAEVIAVGSQTLTNTAATMTMTSSQVYAYFELNLRATSPSAYYPVIVNGDITIGQCWKNNNEWLDGRGVVLYCPSTQQTLGYVGVVEALLQNDFWSLNVGCRYYPPQQAWYFAYLGTNITTSNASLSLLVQGTPDVATSEIYVDTSLEQGIQGPINWILEAPSPFPDSDCTGTCTSTDPSTYYQRYIPCNMSPGAYTALPSQDPNDYLDKNTYGTAGRYRNLLYAENPQLSNFSGGFRVGACLSYTWPQCSDQSLQDQIEGLPCRTWAFNYERDPANWVNAFGGCFGIASSSIRLLTYSTDPSSSQQYIEQFIGAANELSGGPLYGGTLGPMGTAQDLDTSSLSSFTFPQNNADTPTIIPLANVNMQPDVNTGPTCAEGRSFDSYGASGTNARGTCAVNLNRLGPLPAMTVSNSMSVHWQYPTLFIYDIEWPPWVTLSINVSLQTATANYTFELGYISAQGTTVNAVLASELTPVDNATALMFDAEIINVSMFGQPPVQNGQIVAVRDLWRPGAVISFDEAANFAQSTFGTVTPGEQTLTYAQLAQILEVRSPIPNDNTVQPLAAQYGMQLPSQNFNNYLCCTDPGAFSNYKLALLRSALPDMDFVPEAVALYGIATVFRSVARRGTGVDGLNDSPTIGLNPWTQCMYQHDDVAVLCPPSPNWIWINQPAGRANFGPNCQQWGITNEWFGTDQNIMKVCQSGQEGVCIPTLDQLTGDQPFSYETMLALRTAAFHAVCNSSGGCNSQRIPYYPPFLQPLDGGLHAYTCQAGLCFDPVDNFGPVIEIAISTNAQLLGVIVNLPTARLVDVSNEPGNECNVTLQQTGALSVGVENTGTVDGSFSVYIVFPEAANYVVNSPSPAQVTVSPGETAIVRFQIFASSTAPQAAQSGTLTLRDAIGGVLGTQVATCLTLTNVLVPNSSFVPPPSTPAPTINFGPPVTSLQAILIYVVVVLGAVILGILLVVGILRARAKVEHNRLLRRRQQLTSEINIEMARNIT
jgi:hypothetical protein